MKTTKYIIENSQIGKAAMLWVKFQIFLISFGIIGAIISALAS